MLLALPGCLFGVPATGVSKITAAETGRVTIQELAIEPWCRHAEAVALARHRREISHRQDEIAGIAGAADERNHALVYVVKVDPLKAFPTEIDLVKRRLLDVKLVECLDIRLNFPVVVVIKERPVELPVMITLAPLADLPSHEEQLLAGMGVHIHVESSQVRELLPVVAWHLAEHGAFAMHHFIMREGQNEVLSESIEQRESQVVLVITAVDRVFLHVFEHVMHPPHVPFQIEAQAAEIGWA